MAQRLSRRAREELLRQLPSNAQKLYSFVAKSPRTQFSVQELANKGSLTPAEILQVWPLIRGLTGLGKLSAETTVPRSFLEDIADVPRERVPTISPGWFEQHPLRFGGTADTHIASIYHIGNHHSKKGPLWDFYRLCADQGITHVFHGGNWVEGNAPFNAGSTRSSGLTSQLEMFINEYPYAPGVKTVFIAGDDHEGWWWRRDQADVALYAAMHADWGGRKDMDFIGYIDADIAIVPHKDPAKRFRYNRYAREMDEIKYWRPTGAREEVDFPKEKRLDLPRSGYSIMRLAHSGGGTAYAKSIKSQKEIETMQDGEKPQVHLIGHFHKAVYDYIRNCHTVQLGTTEDRTDFMRKLNIPADVGSWTFEITQDEASGAILTFKPTFYPWNIRGPNFTVDKYSMNRSLRRRLDGR